MAQKKGEEAAVSRPARKPAPDVGMVIGGGFLLFVGIAAGLPPYAESRWLGLLGFLLVLLFVSAIGATLSGLLKK